MAGIEEVDSMEELHARRTLTKKDGPRDSNLLELNQSPDEWLDSIMTAQSPENSPIPRVPQRLHESKDFEKHYEPRVVSIGPYHFGNSNLQKVHKLKCKIAKKFVSDNRNDLKNLCDKVLSICRDQNLYTWYEENSINKYSDEAFARMMVLDGCFVLYYIECILNDVKEGQKPKIDDLEMKGHDVVLVQQDLLLLENQLPFPVLKVLMEARKKFWQNYILKIDSFILDHILGYSRELRKENCYRNNLDRVKLGFKLVKEQLRGTTVPQPKPLNQTAQDPTHLLQHLQNTLIGTDIKIVQSQCTNNRYTFRNVDELLEVGIQFRPSRSNRLNSINYVPGWFHTYLELPFITVDDSTRAMFLNLIAYEMCSDPLNKSWVTSYICFLDSLIDHPGDVKVLRSAGVLHNCLGSDEEVSLLFNDIGYDLVPNPMAYNEVKGLIQEHYNTPAKTWMAQFYHEHFRSPWSIFALLGALTALFLSGVQAYFSVWSLPSDCEGLCKYIRQTRYV
ncbi:hypothetical protein LguiB_004233 [Lonicera macranthoides]